MHQAPASVELCSVSVQADVAGVDAAVQAKPSGELVSSSVQAECAGAPAHFRIFEFVDVSAQTVHKSEQLHVSTHVQTNLSVRPNLLYCGLFEHHYELFGVAHNPSESVSVQTLLSVGPDSEFGLTQHGMPWFPPPPPPILDAQ